MEFGGAWNAGEGQRRDRGDLRDVDRGGRDQRGVPGDLAGVRGGPGRALRDGERGGDLRGGHGGAEGEGRVHSVGSVVANLFPEPTLRQTSGQRMTPGGRIPQFSFSGSNCGGRSRSEPFLE